MNRLSYAFRRRLRAWTHAAAAAPHGCSIVIVTHNRRAFLERTVAALLGSELTLPHEILVWDNASEDGTADFLDQLEARHDQVRVFRSKRNLGTSAYALAFLEAKYHYLVEVDDDILAVSPGWDVVMARAFETVPRLAYAALDVVQDRFTNGAKPDAQRYRVERHGNLQIQIGPVGGWFAITTRPIYDAAGGFLYRPGHVFEGEDGHYAGKVRSQGYRTAIVQNAIAYHATGPTWNQAYGFHSVWRAKYAERFPSLVPLVDQAADVRPEFAMAEDAVERALRDRHEGEP